MKVPVFVILTLMLNGLFAQSTMDTLWPVYMRNDLRHDVFVDTIGKAHSSIDVKSNTLYSGSVTKSSFICKPRAFGEFMGGDGLPYSAGAGCWLGFLNTKMSAVFVPEFTHANYPNYIGEKFDSMKVFPGGGKVLYSSGNSFGVLSFPLYLKYRMSNVFSLEGGNGKAFLGDGYRSVLLSDQSAEYPFVRIVADVDKIKYIHQISRWRQQMPNGHNETKFSATHYLSWMVTKKLNVSLFESVTWKAQDSVRQRGFEWLYLNPVLFFRPAEFALGSPDNMLLGGNVSWNIFPKTKLYGQILLDEFFISEIKNWIKHTLHPDDVSIPHGAWVNKQAFQLGVKSVGVFGMEGLNALAEFNFARPYVYSHRDPMMSYTNMNQPVAHPLGGNFYEFIFRSQYKKEKWSAHLNAMYYVTGLDSVGSHFGQDLLQSTFDGPVGNGNIPVQYYGNYSGQGVRHDIAQLSAEYRRNFSFGNNYLTWRLGAMIRSDKTIQDIQKEMYVFTGVFLNLQPGEWNQR